MARCSLPAEIVLELDAAGLLTPEARFATGFGRGEANVIKVTSSMAMWCRRCAANVELAEPMRAERYRGAAEAIETALDWEASDRGDHA